MIIKITELAYVVRKKCKGTDKRQTSQTQTSEKNKQRRKLGPPSQTFAASTWLITITYKHDKHVYAHTCTCKFCNADQDASTGRKKVH